MHCIKKILCVLLFSSLLSYAMKPTSDQKHAHRAAVSFIELIKKINNHYGNQNAVDYNPGNSVYVDININRCDESKGQTNAGLAVLCDKDTLPCAFHGPWGTWTFSSGNSIRGQGVVRFWQDLQKETEVKQLDSIMQNGYAYHRYALLGVFSYYAPKIFLKLPPVQYCEKENCLKADHVRELREKLTQHVLAKLSIAQDDSTEQSPAIVR